MRKQTTAFVMFVVAAFLCCAGTRASAAWQIETVPFSIIEGYNTMVLDATDLPHIATSDKGSVVYVHKSVSGWQEEKLTNSGTSMTPVLEIDSKGFPHIFYITLYYRGGMGGCYYKYFIVRRDASGWTYSYVSSVVDLVSDDFQPYAFALDSNDGEHSFRDNTEIGYDFDLKIQYDQETVITADWILSSYNQLTIDLAMDSLDYPHIAYRGSINLPLTYLYKDGSGWHSETIDIAGSTADYLSLALDSNDRPHVSYYDNVNKDLKYAFRDETGWHLEIVDSLGDVGGYNSIGVDSQDIPHVSYYDRTNGDLKYARLDETGWHIETVDSAGDVGYWSCLDIDSLDRPHIAYKEYPNQFLKYTIGPLDCQEDADCPEGFECLDGACEPIPDNPPVLTAGPFVAAGAWPLLPTSQESPVYLDANSDVLWKFSDDFVSCSEDCTHSAEYQAVGGSSWTAVDVTANAAKGTAYVTLPVESLQNATTYAFRYSVTDCASQTTQSSTYYFRVAVTDAPPVIGSGPFVAAGAWPALPTSASKAFVLDQNYNVLWKFSDDYAFCSGLCKHRARYRKVGDTAWIWLTVSADPTGKKYAYTELPVVGLEAGTYQFYFDVRDCNGQYKYLTIYYFKVE